jgi:hypothetical protein
VRFGRQCGKRGRAHSVDARERIGDAANVVPRAEDGVAQSVALRAPCVAHEALRIERREAERGARQEAVVEIGAVAVGRVPVAGEALLACARFARRARQPPVRRREAEEGLAGVGEQASRLRVASRLELRRDREREAGGEQREDHDHHHDLDEREGDLA